MSVSLVLQHEQELLVQASRAYWITRCPWWALLPPHSSVLRHRTAPGTHSHARPLGGIACHNIFIFTFLSKH
jgi:hypothetical protein